MKDRLKELRKTQGLKQREFAERVGVSTGRVGGWESGTDRPGDARIDKICNVFHVRREWLEKGEGEMFEPEQAPPSRDEVLREAAYALFRELSEPAQHAVMQVMADINMKALEEKINAPKPGNGGVKPDAEKTLPAETLVAMR